MVPTTSQLIEHAYALAKAFEVELRLHTHRDDGTEWPRDLAVAGKCTCGCDRWVVLARTISDDTGYAIVLHELGHCLSPWGTLRFALKLEEPKPGCHPRERHRWINLKLEEEEAAWAWARHHALYWSLAMEQVEQYGYRSYIEEKANTR